MLQHQPLDHQDSKVDVVNLEKTSEKKCIFCKKGKFVKGTFTRESLSMCMQLRGDDRIRQTSKIREDSDMMTLSADDLIAKEAFYHASCYKAYTKFIHALEKCDDEVDKTVDESDEAFEAVKKKLRELYDDPDIVEFTTINLYESLLQSSSIESERIKYLEHTGTTCM